MKKNFKLILSILILNSQIFALAGLGVYGDFDLLKYPSGTSGDINGAGVSYEGFDNASGIGLMLYVDAIPFVDLQFDVEFVGNIYKYTPYLVGAPLSTEELPWGRVSTYTTIRKNILGLSIPFLAKAQWYGGLGFNNHKVVPIMTSEVIEDALGSVDLESALDTFNSNSEDAAKNLAKGMLDNVVNISGLHVQTGVRAKLLMFNVFANARYTLAKDVIPDKSGYPSIWIGLAVGI